MVIVVPAFSKGKHAEHRVVPALVSDRKRPPSPQVTDGVDAPGHVVNQEDPDETAPDEPEESPHPTASKDRTQRCRHQESNQDPEREEAAHVSQEPAAAEILDVVGETGRVRLKQPAHVGVPQPAEETADPRTCVVRRMRVAIAIAVLVVTPVHCHPLQEGTLNSHRAENAEEELDDLMGLE